jgi:hypothetical protein
LRIWFLPQASLGYKPGSDDYETYYSDHWHWTMWFSTSRAGRWTTDPIEYAALVEANTRLGLANPPRSYLDIPRIGPPVPGLKDPAPAPVPLPAPILLSLAGVAAFVAMRGRRAPSGA